MRASYISPLLYAESLLIILRVLRFVIVECRHLVSGGVTNCDWIDLLCYFSAIISNINQSMGFGSIIIFLT